MRIYGETAEELENRLAFLKEARARDHRKRGKDLELFSIQDEIRTRLVLWHPKGSIFRHEIENARYEEHLKNGYQLVNTPHIAKLDLWKTSDEEQPNKNSAPRIHQKGDRGKHNREEFIEKVISIIQHKEFNYEI